MSNNNVLENITMQFEKETYIVNMLVRTLYSNDVNINECYRILKLFKQQILGDVDI